MDSPDRPTPSADAIAAIAAAYLAFTRRSGSPAGPDASRWRLAGRLASADDVRLRGVSRLASRWRAAGRLDG